MSRHHEAPDPRQSHLKLLEPVPPEAKTDPLGWAEKRIESLAPDAVKELEWGLYFGSDTMRRDNAKDLLAMKGITTKPKEQAAVQQAMVFNVTQQTLPSGAPVMPFSNAGRALPPGDAGTPSLDTKKAPVIVSGVAPNPESK